MACGGPPAHKQLMSAVKAGDAGRVAELLSKNVDIGYADERGKTCLHYGARQASALFKILIENCSIDDATREDRSGRTPLMTACNFGEEDNVRVLLTKIGHDSITRAIETYDHGFCNSLHFCAAQGHSNVTALLLSEFRKAGGDVTELVNSCDGGQNTPLHKAGISGNAPTIRLLLEAGADPNCVNCDGMTSQQCCETAQMGNIDSCLEVYAAFVDMAGKK